MGKGWRVVVRENALAGSPSRDDLQRRRAIGGQGSRSAAAASAAKPGTVTASER